VNLVHRDIKPSNIMVRLRDEGGITAKIIALGLAKAITINTLRKIGQNVSRLSS
jgi:serine/threonine protein kinase